MSDFDYGNARLRAMKSRLLPSPTLEGLAEAGNVDNLITALANTAYRDAVGAALVRLAGMDCLSAALRNDLVATVGQARRFFKDGPGELSALVLRRYDLHNLKAVLRGVARHVPANEILASTLPIGELRPADLTELARSANVRAAIDLLVTWRLALAQPLLELRGGRRGESLEVTALELALERWHLRSALEAAREAGETGQALLEALLLEADVTNILTALRLVGVTDLAPLRAHFGVEALTALFLGPGRVQPALLAEAARQPSIAEAVNALAGTPYRAVLLEALKAYSLSNHLSVFERALTRYQLQQAAQLFTRDALGIGVLLGYVALKTNEIANLRAIAQGLLLVEKPAHIRAELMLLN